MCHLCERGLRQHDCLSRRHFLKAGAAATLGVFASPSVFAQGPPASHLPADSGRPGRRYVIRGGAVMSMDPAVGDFQRADVLVEGKKIVAVGLNVNGGDASVIDARGRIVMPGFVDTHHHQFETALRSFLADGLLASDGKPHGAVNYFDYILGKFARVYRPQDVYINELFGSLSQLDAASQPSTTSRRSIIRPSTRMRRSRASRIQAAARRSGTSKVMATRPNIQMTPPVSKGSTFRPTISSSP